MIILSYLPHSFEKIHIIELYRIFVNELIPYWWAFKLFLWVGFVSFKKQGFNETSESGAW